MEDIPHFYAANRKSWRSWLEKNHEEQSAIWLVFDKGKDRTMTWQDIVEESLCYGWIDSRPGKVSDTQSKIYVSKRKPKSVWSKINKQNVEKLTKQGLMKPAGLQSVAIAKQNGSWDALNLSDNLVYPVELEELFRSNNSARLNFENFSKGTRKNTLQWIYDAKTEPTKLARIKQTFEAAQENIKLR